jgi:uncharacterized protein (DUF1684 family)
VLSCNREEKIYQKEVHDFRAMKNESFSNTSSSPLSKIQRNQFVGLQYFDTNSTFKIKAKFVPSSMPMYVSLFESDDNIKQIHVTRGRLFFAINGTNCNLIAYSSTGQAKHSLFVPFSDTHKSTYPGGRYLDGHLLNDTVCLLDFNLSYNPYCVYNEHYKCAVVPAKNRLQVSIPAGEKWKADH